MRIACRSVPASGSVSASPPRTSPVANLGSQWRFCGSVPNFSMASASIRWELKMPVIAIHTDGDRASRSRRRSWPAGRARHTPALTVAPNRPSSFICSTISAGQRSAWSNSLTRGATSRSTQRSMVARSCASSALSMVFCGPFMRSSRVAIMPYGRRWTRPRSLRSKCMMSAQIVSSHTTSPWEPRGARRLEGWAKGEVCSPQI